MTEDASAARPATVPPGTFLGSGLSAPLYGALLLVSVALFVWFGGPLWSASGSHGLRFLVSYGAVVPLAGGALVATRAFDWPSFATAVGTLWAIKLLITAPLYYALAPGGALEDIGAIHPARASALAPRAVPTSAYQAATGEVPVGTLRGRVTRGGDGLARAVVVLDGVHAGKPNREGRELVVKLTERGFDAAIYLMSVDDPLKIHNDGQRLHTARVRSDGHTRLNAPVPPSTTTTPLRVEAPGMLDITCETHPDEHAALVVVDHPYAVYTEDDGSFRLDDVTVGTVTVRAVWAASGELRSAQQAVLIREGVSANVGLELDETPDSEEHDSK